jgi:hypothetical protein
MKKKINLWGERFKKKKYFLLDTMKCILKKNNELAIG